MEEPKNNAEKYVLIASNVFFFLQISCSANSTERDETLPFQHFAGSTRHMVRGHCLSFLGTCGGKKLQGNGK